MCLCAENSLHLVGLDPLEKFTIVCHTGNLRERERERVNERERERETLARVSG